MENTPTGPASSDPYMAFLKDSESRLNTELVGKMEYEVAYAGIEQLFNDSGIQRVISDDETRERRLRRIYRGHRLNALRVESTSIEDMFAQERRLEDELKEETIRQKYFLEALAFTRVRQVSMSEEKKTWNKKRHMARIATHQDHPTNPLWLQLCDDALEGEPLDLSHDDDRTLVKQLENRAADNDQRRQAKVTDLMRILHTESMDFQRFWAISQAAFVGVHIGEILSSPDKEEELHKLARESQLNPEQTDTFVAYFSNSEQMPESE